MRHWHETRDLPFETFVTPDGLHMNDWGYDCWAKLLGASIAEATTRPTPHAITSASMTPAIVAGEGSRAGPLTAVRPAPFKFYSTRFCSAP